MDYDEIIDNALAWGKRHHPDSNNFRHCAFANSVAYLVTGASGGYGGPSMREHAVSWALVGDGSIGQHLGLTMLTPDGRLPLAGQWPFDRACSFAEPICYGQLPAICRQIAGREACFDDDPDDLRALGLI